MLLPLGADLVLTPNLGDTGDGLQHLYLNGTASIPSPLIGRPISWAIFPE
jgi:hypothetical protein